MPRALSDALSSQEACRYYLLKFLLSHMSLPRSHLIRFLSLTDSRIIFHLAAEMLLTAWSLIKCH